MTYDPVDRPAEIVRLRAELAAEREARLHLETCGMVELMQVNPNVKSYVEEREGHTLRAEAGAAVMRKAFKAILTRLYTTNDDTAVGICFPIAVEELESAQAALQDDTGARLAAVVEEARKMGCEKPPFAGGTCLTAYRFATEHWCFSCKLVDAVGR